MHINLHISEYFINFASSLKPIDMKSLFTILLLFVTINLKAQMYWQRPVVNYNRHEYGASNQNWMIDQHDNGWMYFANNKGLLEFDGVYWNLYPIANHSKARSIKVGKDNKIYTGGLREFGYFAPNRLGGLDYTSLSSKLPAKKISNIWKVLVTDHKVYYQGDSRFFCYADGKLSTVDCNGVAFSEVINNKIYFTNTIGLYHLYKGKPRLVPGSTFIGKLNIVALLPWQGKIILITANHGIYLYDGEKFTRPFTSIESSLTDRTISCAAIHNQMFAIGTIDSGLHLFNIYKNTEEKISIANGLQNKSQLSLKFDKDGNLWLGLDNGIDYIAFNTPLFFLNSKQSSIGAGYCSSLLAGKLFLGTNQGVYSSTVPSSTNVSVSLTPIAGMSGQVHCMYQYDNLLFCGGRRFLAYTDGKHTTIVPSQRGIWQMQAVSNHNADIIVMGSYWGLKVMRKVAGAWTYTNNIKGFDISSKSMYVEPESNNIWIANKTDGIWRVTTDLNFTKVLHKKCYNNQLLPAGDNAFITRIANNIVIASHHGLFRYNAKDDRLEPFTQLEKRLGGHHCYTYLKQESNGELWYVCQGELKRTYTGEATSQPFLSDNMIEDFEHVNQLSYNQAIVGTEDGFVMIDNAVKDIKSMPIPHLQIRKLYVTNGRDSLAYGMSFANNDTPLNIKYRDNSVRIEYSASNYNRLQAVTYSYRLKGFTDKWSDYTTNTRKEYTDLPEGKYTFEVKIMPNEGGKPVISQLSFRILPPWYRSWWAYILYIIGMLLMIYDVFRRYKQSREKLIKQKNEELSKQKSIYEEDINQKNKQIDDLEAEKLRNELQYKSDELVKTTLNVVRKNEILLKIKKDAENLSSTIGKEDLVHIRRSMLRLINQINTNIEHDSDLDSFQSSFDAVHHDFFKKLDGQFPELTHKDKMLCAYIRMDLMSKEIAPLLNISERGVEISRYRLRKKMGLETNVNLMEFLRRL